MRATRATLAIAAASGAVLASSTTAGAIPFGTNLARTPAEDAPTCPAFQPFTPTASCAWQSVNLQTGESPFPPTGNGVVTQVRVRVGASTGPMQMVVLRGLRSAAQVPGQGGPIDPNDPNGPQFYTPGSQAYVCCKTMALSQVFTPAPNGITTVPVNLPTRNDLAPDPLTGVYVGEFLALQILAPDVRVPVAERPRGDRRRLLPRMAARRRGARRRVRPDRRRHPLRRRLDADGGQRGPRHSRVRRGPVRHRHAARPGARSRDAPGDRRCARPRRVDSAPRQESAHG